MRPDKTGRLVILNRPSGVILKIVPPGVHWFIPVPPAAAAP
jgi:hypothetical protein